MRRGIILTFIFCFAIGLGIAGHGTASAGDGQYVSPKSVDEYKAVIEGEKAALSNVNATLADTNEKYELYKAALDEYNTDVDRADMTAAMEEEALRLRMYNGLESVRGPGVVVTIDDGTRELYEGENINNVLVHDIDVLMIINELKRNGAEAVSVNGQRIIDSTAIYCSGYTIRINDVVYARPFVISAIGDAKRMASALVAPEGYGTNLKEWGLLFEVETKDDILIEKYRGARQGFTYAENSQGEKGDGTGI